MERGKQRLGVRRRLVVPRVMVAQGRGDIDAVGVLLGNTAPGEARKGRGELLVTTPSDGPVAWCC